MIEIWKPKSKSLKERMEDPRPWTPPKGCFYHSRREDEEDWNKDPEGNLAKSVKMWSEIPEFGEHPKT